MQILATDRIAVIGASRSPEKYGYKVFKDLLEAGYEVLAVNPKAETILDQPVYSSLADVPGQIDLVVFVVPPVVAQKILPRLEELGINKVWFQPGSESQAALEFCNQHRIEATSSSCVMLQRL